MRPSTAAPSRPATSTATRSSTSCSRAPARARADQQRRRGGVHARPRHRAARRARRAARESARRRAAGARARQCRRRCRRLLEHGRHVHARANLGHGTDECRGNGRFQRRRPSRSRVRARHCEPPSVPSALVWLTTSNAGNPFFISDKLGAAAARRLLVNDFNVDSRSDVLAVSGYGARIFTNAGAASGTFVLHPQQLATPGARGAAMGKFSGDDRVDLAIVGDGVAIFINDGTGNFAHRT